MPSCCCVELTVCLHYMVLVAGMSYGGMTPGCYLWCKRVALSNMGVPLVGGGVAYCSAGTPECICTGQRTCRCGVWSFLVSCCGCGEQKCV
jgi:hypothetical protein